METFFHLHWVLARSMEICWTTVAIFFGIAIVMALRRKDHATFGYLAAATCAAFVAATISRLAATDSTQRLFWGIVMFLTAVLFFYFLKSSKKASRKYLNLHHQYYH
jgi:predicted membrane channel-forming protein YqfA (hemolysin III family)